MKHVLISVLILWNLYSWADFLIRDLYFEESSFSNQELSRIIQSSPGRIYQQKIALDDAQKILQFYENRGYFHVKVFPPSIQIVSKDEIDVTFRIEELEPIFIHSIFFEGNRYITSETLLSNLPSLPIKLSDLSSIQSEIISFYADQGFLFAKSELSETRLDSNQMEVVIRIDEGKFCDFEEYLIQGNKVTKQSTVLQITQLNQVQHITPELLELASEQLRIKPYIKDCTIFPLNHRQLLIQIEEDKMTFFSGLIGYDNEKDKENKLNGFLNLEFLNLYGTDRNLSVFWQHLNTDRSSTEISYHESGFYNVAGDFSICREEVDSTYISTQFETELYWHNILWKAGLYYEYEDIFPGRTKTIEKTNFHKIGGLLEYQKLDYSINPRNGYRYEIKYYTILHKIDGNRVNKQALEALYFHALPIKNRLVFTYKVKANIVENKNITRYDYFYLGGNSNLRGFIENQFYGYRTGLLNLELRYLLGRKSRFFLFTDYGYAENDVYRYGKLFGFGFGLRVNTRLGLLGIDYGLGYQNEPRDPFNGVLHFGIETKL